MGAQLGHSRSPGPTLRTRTPRCAHTGVHRRVQHKAALEIKVCTHACPWSPRPEETPWKPDGPEGKGKKKAAVNFLNESVVAKTNKDQRTSGLGRALGDERKWFAALTERGPLCTLRKGAQ